MSFPIPANEAKRLATLHSLDILDSAPEIAYDEIVELAAQVCGCAIACISFIDGDRRWIKASYGLPVATSEAPREAAVCSTTIAGADLFTVPDMTKDPRFELSPLVVGSPHCRFYCGMPLVTDEGYALGSLCVMDVEPRELSPEQRESLRRLSRQVLTQLELRRQLIEHGRTIKELEHARKEVASEKARAEQLLDNVLPASVAEELKRNGKVEPKYTDSATILFADFQGFTLLSEQLRPGLLIDLLDQYFPAFDDIIARYGLEKVKTIGDAYMAVAGVLETDRRDPVNVCFAALEMREKVAAIRSRRERIGLPALELRIGIHSGPVISGVIGTQRFTFDIWGEAVNKASFMEAHCPPGRINISEAVARRVDTFFELESRGSIAVKHERMHRMYFLNRPKAKFSHDDDGERTRDRNFSNCLQLNAAAGHARFRMPLPHFSSRDAYKR